jgi:hypothetical protein
MHKEHKMEKLELVEVTQKKVNCRYRDSDGAFGSKEYTFITTRDHFIGELVVAKDSKGYVLVQVVGEVKESSYTGNYASIVSLDEVNAQAKAVLRKQEIAGQIREAVIRNIENNAFESLAKQYPDMAPMIEEYKASGGSYSDIMPSIVNMLK